MILALLLAAVAGPGNASEPTATARAHGVLGWEGANTEGGVMRLPVHGGAKACRPFSSRVVFPTGYSGPPHTRSVGPNAVVIRDVSNIAFFNRMDRMQARVVDAGGEIFIPDGTVHHEWFDEPTELHLHGTGPMETVLVDPMD